MVLVLGAQVLVLDTQVLVLVLGAQVLVLDTQVLVLVLGAQVLVLDTQVLVLVLVLEEKSLVVSLFLVFFFVVFTKSFSAKPASKHILGLYVRFYLLDIGRNCLR